jgi:YVTN family beta-propeller protein
VTSEIAGAIDIIDVKTLGVVKRLQLPRKDHPCGLVFSPAGDRLYVATGRGNSVAVIDTASRRLLHDVAVGSRPWWLALTHDGRKLYVANGLSDDVSVIDTVTDAVVKTIKVGAGPWGVAVK